MKTMSRAEINAHPRVAAALEAWRKARETRDRIELDGRYAPASGKEARLVANETEKAYDAAVAALLADVAR